LEVHIIPIRAPFSLVQDLEIAHRTQRLYARLSRHKPFDLVHHILPFGSQEAFSIRAGAASPLILGPILPEWQQGHAPMGTLKSVVRWLPVQYALYRHRRSLRDAAYVIVPLRTQGGYFGSISRPTTTIPLGVDVSHFKPLERDAGSGATILFLANLEARKGVLDLVAAFSQLTHRHPQARLVIAGDGSQRRDLEDTISRLGLGESISVLGAIAHDETAHHYQQCDIYCLPSLGEPFGISILEAMACGKPVITTNIGGPAEIVVPQRSGLLVPPRDIAALTQALDYVLTHPAERAAMGAFNRQQVLHKYDWERIVDSIDEIYRRAVGRV
jgi:glycosyltransferase involved in cell wall biosynthesis